MKVLLVKTSSLGDVIHSLPALTDAKKAISEIQFDWVVEEAFQEIPAWHPAVNRVIPVAIRRWRKHLFERQTYRQFGDFRKQLQAQEYDLIIDAQGLVKSALITRLAKGVSVGLDESSAREPMVARTYQQKIFIARQQHAITRVRQLFSVALKYELPKGAAQAGLVFSPQTKDKCLLFFHGTTWASKHWPEAYWLKLAQLASVQGFKVQLPWGNDIERKRADRIAAQVGNVERLDTQNLTELAEHIQQSQAVVGVDTGLMHLAAALNKPAICLFGATNSVLTGAISGHQRNLQADISCSPCMKKNCPKLDELSHQPPCYDRLLPEMVFDQLLLQLRERV